MRAHLVRADELDPGDIVVGTDQDGLYSDGPRVVANVGVRIDWTDPIDTSTARITWTDGEPTTLHPHTVMLVNPNR
jgi:hypothetical protein